MTGEAFKAGEAYLDLDVRDQTPEGIRRIKERIERGDHATLTVKADQPLDDVFRARVEEAVKAIRPEVTTTATDPITTRWKEQVDQGTKTPREVPVTATDPINAAWRAKVQESIRAISADAIKIPMTPETAKYREELELAVGELSSAVHQKIPVDMDQADQFRIHVRELAKELSAEVKVHIPVEVDQQKVKADAKKAADDASAAMRAAFSGGAAPIPGLIGAAVLAGAPLIGGALVGAVGAGFVALDAVVAARSEEVTNQWTQMVSNMRAITADTAPYLTAPFVKATAEIRSNVAMIGPEIQSDMITSAQYVKPLTDGLVGLARNALPGVSMALLTGEPVIQGFKVLLSDTGQEVGDMFESFSGHSHAFGTDIQSLSSIVRSAMTFITNVVNQTGEAWASSSGQIDDAISALFGGLGQLSGTAVPALVTEFADLLSILGVVASVTGTVSTAVGPLAGYLMATALAAKVLGVNLTAIPGAIKAIPDKVLDIATSSSKFSGVAEGLLPLLGGLGLAAGSVAAGFGLVALGASSAAAKDKELADQGIALGQAMVKGGQGSDDAVRKLADLRSNVDAAQHQIDELTHQQNAGTTATNEYGGAFSATASKSMELQGKIQDARTVLNKANQEFTDYSAQLGTVGVAQAKASEAQKEYNKAVATYGETSPQAIAAMSALTTANNNVTSAQQNAANAMNLAAKASGTFSTNSSLLAKDLAKIGDAASTDTDKISAMKDALVRLSGGTIPVEDALEAVHKTLTGISTVANQAGAGVDGYGKALINADNTVNTTLKNGQSLRDALTTLRGNFVDVAAAITAQDQAQGKSTDQIKAHVQAVLNEQLPSLYKFGAALGLNTDQVNRLLDKENLLPAEIATTVVTPGVLNAQQAMDILRNKVLDVPNDHTVVTSALTDTAINQLRGLGYVVETLPNGQIKVTADTTLAAQAAQARVDAINQLHANITVSTKDASGSWAQLHEAQGGMVVPMADGGVMGMSGAFSQFVPANTPRLIGDNIRVPELFAPLDGSPRTAANIRAAATHEGVILPTQRASDIVVTVNQTVSTQDPDRAAAVALAGVARAVGSARR